MLLTTGSANHVRVFTSKLNKVDTDSSRRKVCIVDGGGAGDDAAGGAQAAAARRVRGVPGPRLCLAPPRRPPGAGVRSVRGVREPDCGY